MAPLPADHGLIFWLLAALHLAGLASMLLARLPQSPGLQAWFQPAFLACLLFVGLATLFTICVQHDCWAWSSTVFSMMAVGATVDLSPGARAAGF